MNSGFGLKDNKRTTKNKKRLVTFLNYKTYTAGNEFNYQFKKRINKNRFRRECQSFRARDYRDTVGGKTCSWKGRYIKRFDD